MVIPILLRFYSFKFEHCKPHKVARHPTKDDVINDVKLFPTVYRSIYCRKFLMLFNQTYALEFKIIVPLFDAVVAVFIKPYKVGVPLLWKIWCCTYQKGIYDLKHQKIGHSYQDM